MCVRACMRGERGDRGRKIMGGGEVMQVVSPEIEELGRVNPTGGVSNKPCVQTK